MENLGLVQTLSLIQQYKPKSLNPLLIRSLVQTARSVLSFIFIDLKMGLTENFIS